MKKLADKLSQKIEKLEGVKSKKAKTSISFARNFPFAKINIKPRSLELEFITPSKIKHTTLKKIKQLKTNKVQHTIVISKEEDINVQVDGWLMIAHATN